MGGSNLMSAIAGRVLLIPKGNYDSTATYTMLDMVVYNGSSYICKQECTGVVPTNTTYWMLNASGSAVAYINDIGDVVITNPTNGQVLMYNSTTQEWVNGTLTLNGLNDTQFASLSDGQVLKYNATSQKWENADEAGGILPHLIVISETGSTVTATKGQTVITATETSTGHFECDLPEFGTWTIDAILGGDDAQVSLVVDTVKVYTVDDSHFHGTLTVKYPDGATCRLQSADETLYATGSPYTFTVHHAETYTITVTYNQRIYTDTVTFTTEGQSFSKTLPSPSEVDANDINWWLFFGGVSGSYSSLADILANSTALSTLMASTDAVDYLVRCKEWINAGLVPVMTSNTTPSGECIKSGAEASGTEAFRAFDGNDSTYWASNASTNQYVGYKFTSAKNVKGARIIANFETEARIKNFKIQGSNDNSTWTDLYTGVYPNTQGYEFIAEFDNDSEYLYYRIYVIDCYSASHYIRVSTLQFYPMAEGVTNNQSAMSYIGLNNYCANTLLADADWCDGIFNSAYMESVLNVKIPTMTSNTQPSGIVSGDATFRSGNEGYKAFDNNDTTYAFSSVSSTEQSTFYCEYDFPSNLNAYVLNYTFGSPSQSVGQYNVNLQYYDGEEWIDELTDLSVPASGTYSETRNINIKNCSKFRIYGNRVVGSGSSAKLSPIMNTIQIYGREDV